MRAEAVHFNEKLVKCLLSLVVTATETCATVSTNCVDFVNEDNGCRRLSCRIEKVTNTGRTNTYVHFNEVRARNREEGNARFTCHGFSKKCLTRTGRAHEQ